jgi:hypothetical protein
MDGRYTYQYVPPSKTSDKGTFFCFSADGVGSGLWSFKRDFEDETVAQQNTAEPHGEEVEPELVAEPVTARNDTRVEELP